MAKPAQKSRTRSRGFQAAGASARPMVRKAAADKGFAEPDVLLRWPEIAGEALARLCRPVKVAYSRGGFGASLIVQTSSARAPEVEHLAPRMIERINQFYGYRAVSRIRITQSTGLGRGFAEDQAGFDGPGAPSAKTRARAHSMTDGIEDADLRAALTTLGAHVLSRPARPRSKGDDSR